MPSERQAMGSAEPIGRFRDRAEAGRLLAERLKDFRVREDVLVLGLPRGGVPVAYEVARELDAPLDVFVVRKLGVPGYEELAMGAIASGGTRVLNDSVIRAVGITKAQIARAVAAESRELERQESLYRGEFAGAIVVNLERRALHLTC